MVEEERLENIVERWSDLTSHPTAEAQQIMEGGACDTWRPFTVAEFAQIHGYSKYKAQWVDNYSTSRAAARTKVIASHVMSKWKGSAEVRKALHNSRNCTASRCGCPSKDSRSCPSPPIAESKNEVFMSASSTSEDESLAQEPQGEENAHKQPPRDPPAVVAALVAMAQDAEEFDPVTGAPLCEYKSHPDWSPQQSNLLQSTEQVIQPEELPIDAEHAAHLEVMREMGFDGDMALAALMEHDGDIDAAAQALLTPSPSSLHIPAQSDEAEYDKTVQASLLAASLVSREEEEFQAVLEAEELLLRHKVCTKLQRAMADSFPEEGKAILAAAMQDGCPVVIRYDGGPLDPCCGHLRSIIPLEWVPTKNQHQLPRLLATCHSRDASPKVFLLHRILELWDCHGAGANKTSTAEQDAMPIGMPHSLSLSDMSHNHVQGRRVDSMRLQVPPQVTNEIERNESKLSGAEEHAQRSDTFLAHEWQSEWDGLLQDLLDMGFEDVIMNSTAVATTNGDFTKAIKFLVTHMRTTLSPKENLDART